jgi:hypothetical protein
MRLGFLLARAGRMVVGAAPNVVIWHPVPKAAWRARMIRELSARD